MGRRPGWASLRSARSQGHGVGRDAGTFTKVLTIVFVGLGGAAAGWLAIPVLLLSEAGRSPTGGILSDISAEDLSTLSTAGAIIGLVVGVSAVIKWWPKD
jgi:hypothetical protein